jgi:thioredoxin 1
MMAPTFEDLANEYAGKMVFAKLNTDENLAVSSQFGIQSIPTLLFFQGGNEVARIIGVRPREDLKRSIENTIAARAS